MPSILEPRSRGRNVIRGSFSFSLDKQGSLVKSWPLHFGNGCNNCNRSLVGGTSTVNPSPFSAGATKPSSPLANPFAGNSSPCGGRERLGFQPPKGEELPAKGFAKGEEGFVAPAENGGGLTVEVPPTSERLQLLQPFPRWNGQDFTKLPLLIKTKGNDHGRHLSGGTGSSIEGISTRSATTCF